MLWLRKSRVGSSLSSSDTLTVKSFSSGLIKFLQFATVLFLARPGPRCQAPLPGLWFAEVQRSRASACLCGIALCHIFLLGRCLRPHKRSSVYGDAIQPPLRGEFVVIENSCNRRLAAWFVLCGMEAAFMSTVNYSANEPVDPH